MDALLDETHTEFLDVAQQIARSIGVANPADIRDRDTLSGWSTLASSGLLELRDRTGGAPLASGVEVALLCRALGTSLVPEPYLPSAAIAADLIARSGDAQAWADDLASGEVLYGIALSADLCRIASPGEQAVMWGGAGPAGYALALQRDGDRWTLLRSSAVGSERLSGISPTNPLWSLDSAEWETGGTLSADDVDRVYALALTGLAADTVGALEAGLRGVVTYSGQRKAYGQHIGSFQSLQHIAADAHTAVEGARAAVFYAAWGVDELSAAEALLAARTAKAAAAAMASGVAEDIMQIYGGIGQTWEHIAHFVTRRVMFDTALLGDEDVHLDEIARARLGGN